MTVTDKITELKSELNESLANTARAVAANDYPTAEREIQSSLRVAHVIMSLRIVDELTGPKGWQRVKVASGLMPN